MKGHGRKLTDTQKAEIALLKDTRPTATSTNKNIAMDFQVSTDLVNRISYESLTDEQKAIYTKKRADLKYLAQDLTYNSIKEANDRVLHDKTAKLSEIMGAAKIGSDIFRLEEGSATSITQTSTPIVFAIQIIENIKVERPGISNAEIVEMIDKGAFEAVPEVDDEAVRKVRGLLAG